MSTVSTLAIAAATARAFEVRLGDVLAPTRGVARQARARQAAMWLAARVGCRSLSEIGAALGRDRSTVRHGVAAVDHAIRRSPELRRQLQALETAIRSAGEEDYVADGELIEIRETILDPVEIAGRALSGPRGVTSISTRELQALARAFLRLAGAPRVEPEDEDRIPTDGDQHG